MKFTPSKENIDIFEHIENSKNNLVVLAVAGSGKTTTLLEALKKIPNHKSVLFMAFNKSIQEELSIKSPVKPNIHIKTVHGFGYSILLDDDPNREISFYKYNNLFKNILTYLKTKNLNVIEKYNFTKTEFKNISKIHEMLEILASEDSFNEEDYISNVLDICNLGRLYNVSLNSRTQLNKICERHGNVFTDEEIKSGMFLIKLGTYYNMEFDFTDMIFLPNVLDLETPTYDYVFIDECQDLNICQRLIMQKAISHNGKFIAVGDPAQAIYGFAGADFDSFKKLINIPNTDQLPLPITYRCPTQIIERVKHIVPQIKTYDGNNNGKIIDDFSHLDLKDGDMVLCRQTLPIVSLCMKLLGLGKTAYVVGSDIGNSLTSMIKKCERKNEEFTIGNVLARLDLEHDKIVTKLMSKHNLSKTQAENQISAISYQEKINAIEAIAKNIKDPNEVINKISLMFSDDNKKGIKLSTIHKAKGLENNNIYILMPELIPSSLAKEEWEIIQEENLRYVAYTRAKKTLGFITDYNAFSKNNRVKIERNKVNNSQYIGSVGDVIRLKVKVNNIRDVNTKFGPTKIYEMIDKDGNLFSKFGVINNKFISDGNSLITEGVNLEFYAKVQSHSEFKGVKSTMINKLKI